MKIAMMSAWNEDSGASTHAELVGREWVKMGHQLKVFSFFPHDFHGTALVERDEDYVTRCFTTASAENQYLDPRPVLEEDFEIFVAQDLGMLPKNCLAKIYPSIRKKACTVTVIHERGPSPDPSFYQFEWDRIVCFDSRYRDFLKRYFPPEKITMIPFPCMLLRRGNKLEARKKLGLPLDKKIALLFGRRTKEHMHLIPSIKEVLGNFPHVLLVVSQKDTHLLKDQSGLHIEIRNEAPALERLYDYLHASDVMIAHRQPCEGVVVSSMAYQCLGSGCPILASDTNFFQTMKDAVITYSTLEEFKAYLFDILTNGKRYRDSQLALGDFIRANSAHRVASRFIDLFKTILEERRQGVFVRFFEPGLYLIPGLPSRLNERGLKGNNQIRASLAQEILDGPRLRGAGPQGDSAS